VSLLEQRLSDGLQSLADEAPNAHGDLARVKTIGRRRQILGRAGVAAAAAVLVVVAVGSVALVRGEQVAPDAAQTDVATSVAPAALAPQPQTVGVTVSGVSGHAGQELAGVLYAGGELADLDRDALGGLWSVIDGDDFTTTEVVREPADPGFGRFPFVSDAALTVEPGTYTLVLWVDYGLSPVRRWVPLNSDGSGLFGCQAVFEIGGDTQTDVAVVANLEPDGWNVDCTTGVAIPGTDAAAAVAPPMDWESDPWEMEPLEMSMPPVTGAADTTPAPTATTVPATMTTTEATTGTEAASTTVAPLSRTWDPVLVTTRAKVVPAPAVCPADSNPNAPGPVDQNRPQLAGYTSNQSAVFDERAGRVIHVDDNGETWAFDVCTNTWTELNPAVDLQGLVVSPRLVQGELVYDVDSDATLYIRGGVVLVYDAADNKWTAQQTPPKSYNINYPGLGAVYDPVSGLVVIQTGDHGLVAYDVDTNTWVEIGTLEGDYPDFLVGYSATTDRLYFLGFQSDGVAVDPRTGRTEPLDQPGVMGGWGAFEFATSTETAYVYGDGVCQLDPTSLDWTCTGTPDIPRGVQNFESMVADPINNRLLLFHGSCCSVYPMMHDDVWALDFDTGEWSLVLEEANRRQHQ
jgi:hypothetical protein